MRAWLLVLALALPACRPTAPPPPATERPPASRPAPAVPPVRHYAYFARDRARIHDSAFLAAAGLEGAQLMYAWRELEPDEGRYDFTALHDDLALLRRHGKRLWLQLQDASFAPQRQVLPRYLLEDPRFHGGAARQYDGGVPAGWVARRWDPAVRARFEALLVRLGQAFDGQLAGVNLQETAIELSPRDGDPPPAGFTAELYRDAVRANMSALRRAFSLTPVMQYANFMPGEWLPDEDHGHLAAIYQHAEQLGIAVGAPDLLPASRGQQQHAYRFMRALQGRIPVGIAVQDGNYAGSTGADRKPDGAWPDLVPQLYAFARDELRVRYIFWAGQEPYFSHDLLPFLQR